MTLTSGTKLDPNEIQSQLGPGAWAKCIALATRTVYGASNTNGVRTGCYER
jgi:hypothetical protein